MKESKNFELQKIRIAVFFKKDVERHDRLVVALRDAKLFNAQVVYTPLDKIPEASIVILDSRDINGNGYNIGYERADLFFSIPALTDYKSYEMDEHFWETLTRFMGIINTEAEVNRIGLIVELFLKDLDYAGPKDLLKAIDGFDPIYNVSMRLSSKRKLKRNSINDVVTVGPGELKLTKDKGAVITRDINTLQEDQQTNTFSIQEIIEFIKDCWPLVTKHDYRKLFLGKSSE